MAHFNDDVFLNRLLVPYNGQSSPKDWLRGFRRIAIASEWKDLETVQRAFSLMHGAAKSWLKSNKDSNEWSYKEFADELLRKFSQTQVDGAAGTMGNSHIEKPKHKWGYRLCYACRKKGHEAKDCPNPRTDGRSRNVTEGHVARIAALPLVEVDTGSDPAPLGKGFSFQNAIAGWSSPLQ